MFIIEKMFIDDKKLPAVLRAVAGLIITMDPPRPVDNAVAKNGKLEQVSSASSKRGHVVQRLATVKGSDVTTKQLKDLMVEAGGVARSVNTGFVQPLIDQKILKRKARGIYHVL